jgi:hypothetical protein
MAMTRTELKDIIKECILEVMLEGIRPKEDEAPARPVRESARPAPPTVGKKHLDSISFGSGAAKVANQAQGRRAPIPAVNDLTTAFPADQRDTMRQIFEDTARNTLPSQMMADRSPHAAISQRADEMSGVSGVDPMSIFEGASNWADLAFSTSKK